MKLLCISLGCDKNLVDTEKMLGILGGEGYSFVDDESDADVIVVAGRGLRKPEDIAMLEELAGLLGGQLGSTRAMVEAGWIDAKRQIGLSGRTVKPKLIITCAVSGAVQFAAGMNGSELIVAINTDPDAPIFNIAHVGIVGDVYEIVPKLAARIKAEKGNLK